MYFDGAMDLDHLILEWKPVCHCESAQRFLSYKMNI